MIQIFTPPEVAIRVYTAIITQAGTANPTVTVLHNTLIGNIEWTRTGVGAYTGTLVDGFKESKTIVFIKSQSYNRILIGTYNSPDEINLINVDTAGGSQDSIPNYTAIEIRVYDHN